MILDPAQYGCSSKLPLIEILNLAQVAGDTEPEGDFSVTLQGGPYAHSIDKIFKCASSWEVFAEIALNHAFGDILAAGATPLHVMLGFEFGADAGTKDRENASVAFFKAANARSVQVGKCHSSIGLGPTAVTIAVCANNVALEKEAPTEGLIFLSRPLGAFKMHFLADMGINNCSAATELLVDRSPKIFPRCAKWSALSDVSGDGLAGTLLSMATRYGLDARVKLGSSVVFAPEVLNLEVSCLINPETSYKNLPIVVPSPKAWDLVRLRETAGPLVGLLNKNYVSPEELESSGALVLGTYVKGTGKVGVEWRE